MASPSESKVEENEVTSEPQNEQGFPLARQSSIYSLTLDEIQNTVCEPGRSFGSMNMDEFLTNIWSVEEGFAAVNNPAPISTEAAPTAANGTGGDQPLHRQGSLTIPAPLCRKTVDEVWAEIHKEREEVRRDAGRAAGGHPGGGGNGGNAQRQPTFGEMTLEDFLIKAGVVREGLGPAASPHLAPPMQQSYNGLSAMSYPVSPTGYEYHHHHHHHHPHHQHLGGSEGGQHEKRYGNGYGAAQQVRMGSPVSPVSSDGFGGGQIDNVGYGGGGVGGGIEMNGAMKMNGRKRGTDGPVEKVAERRQRRMIKNRESAARSRARKQAYTVELEAELNLLKEENSRLREEERRAQALRKQMIVECMAEHAQANMEKALRSLRRCNSGPW